VLRPSIETTLPLGGQLSRAVDANVELTGLLLVLTVKPPLKAAISGCDVVAVSYRLSSATCLHLLVRSGRCETDLARPPEQRPGS
jgi:hypothetical protein